VSVTGHTTRKLIFKVCSRGLSATCRCSASAVFLRPWACIPRISCRRGPRGCAPQRTCEASRSSVPPFSSTCSRPCAYLSWRPCVIQYPRKVRDIPHMSRCVGFHTFADASLPVALLGLVPPTVLSLVLAVCVLPSVPPPSGARFLRHPRAPTPHLGFV
jgi:hypothetical protein